MTLMMPCETITRKLTSPLERSQGLRPELVELETGIESAARTAPWDPAQRSALHAFLGPSCAKDRTDPQFGDTQRLGEYRCTPVFCSDAPRWEPRSSLRRTGSGKGDRGGAG